MATSINAADYRNFMERQQEELVTTIIKACRAEIPFYASMPFEKVEQSVRATVDMCLKALDQQELDATLSWIRDRLISRAGQGIPFKESLSLPIIFRRELHRFSLPAIIEQVPGTESGLNFLMEIFDRVVSMLGEIFQERYSVKHEELTRFKSLADHAIDSIGITDGEGHLTYANPAMREMLGYGDEILETTILDVNDPAGFDRLHAEVLPTLFSTGSWSGWLNHRRKDGTIVPAEVTAVALINPDGSIEATHAIIRDTRAKQAQENRMRMFELLVENAIDGIMVVDFEYNITYVNSALITMSGLDQQSDMIGKPGSMFVAPGEYERIINEIYPQVMEQGSQQWRFWNTRPDGTKFLGETSSFLMTNTDGKPVGIGSFIRDITQEHAAEEIRARLQEQIIQVQQETLRELSTPVIPISRHVLVLPLIGSIDSRRAQQVLQSLLAGLQEHRARIAIIDITGVPIVDTQVANALIQAAQTAQLLGAKVILTGIRPEVAQTLVGLGTNLGAITTHASLQTAIAAAFRD